MNILMGVIHIFTGFLIIAFCIPLVMGKVSMNRLYGIRFKKSYESDELWYKINAYGGRQMILWCIPIIMAGIACFFIDFAHRPALQTVMGCFPLILLIPTATSWWYARKL